MRSSNQLRRHVPMLWSVVRHSPDTGGNRLGKGKIKKMNARLWLVVLSCVAAGFAFSATGHHPYGFYTLTRWVVFLTACLGVFLFWSRFWKSPGPAYVVVGIIFNPLLPFHFQRATWHDLDIAAGAVFLLSLAFTQQIQPSSKGD